jgi:hypothetical protein
MAFDQFDAEAKKNITGQDMPLSKRLGEGPPSSQACEMNKSHLRPAVLLFSFNA